MSTPLPKFVEFIRERQFLHKRLPGHGPVAHAQPEMDPNENPTESELRDTVVRMRRKGLKATGCNSVIRSVNAYLHWATDHNNPCSPACKRLRLRAMKEKEKELPPFTDTPD